MKRCRRSNAIYIYTLYLGRVIELFGYGTVWIQWIYLTIRYFTCFNRVFDLETWLNDWWTVINPSCRTHSVTLSSPWNKHHSHITYIYTVRFKPLIMNMSIYTETELNWIYTETKLWYLYHISEKIKNSLLSCFFKTENWIINSLKIKLCTYL